MQRTDYCSRGIVPGKRSDKAGFWCCVRWLSLGPCGEALQLLHPRVANSTAAQTIKPDTKHSSCSRASVPWPFQPKLVPPRRLALELVPAEIEGFAPAARGHKAISPELGEPHRPSAKEHVWYRLKHSGHGVAWRKAARVVQRLVQRRRRCRHWRASRLHR